MENDSNNTENKILEAAEQLFVEQGFDKTTTSQIARLAGCNQALVHYYYRTKENLFEKIFEDKFRYLITNMLSISTIDSDRFSDTIVRMVETHFDFLVKNSKLPTFVLKESLANPDRIKSLVMRLKQLPISVMKSLDVQLNSAVENGEIRPISGIDLLLTIVSLNVTPFVVNPIIANVLDMSDEEYNDILLKRKQEIVETVLARLRC